ncbi:MAG: carboxylating nicotinate-nucleotide diphosphorylase [Planctomycetota bacterium]|nr:MAG: carboxylating nicotinate-nucleotide diphosphorylase [Planctomycetota bacterium]
MNRFSDFEQQTIDAALLDDLTQLVRLAVREDLDRGVDLTTLALVPSNLQARADIVARQAGVACGLPLIANIIDAMGARIDVAAHMQEGQSFAAGTKLATLQGGARDVLTCERTVLNILSRLCGVATTAFQFCERVRDLPVRLYDTRKTTPGWRRLEKYAARTGGAHNHRLGLYDAVLIKDNHLACRARGTGQALTPQQAVEVARRFVQEQTPRKRPIAIEIEVDSLEQLASALQARPDIVLLDNMLPETLRAAVQLRNSTAPEVELEASGGVRLETVRSIAETGVDRISIGALTHSPISVDLGLDWHLD